MEAGSKPRRREDARNGNGGVVLRTKLGPVARAPGLEASQCHASLSRNLTSSRPRPSTINAIVSSFLSSL